MPLDVLPKARLADLIDTRWPMTDRVAALVTRLIAAGTATTRPGLVTATGLARSTLNAQLDRLVRSDIVLRRESGTAAGRGRPAEQLALNPACGFVLVADLTPHHANLALANLAQAILAQTRIDLDIADGPEAILDLVTRSALDMVTRRGLDAHQIRVVVMSLPGPVDIHGGRPVRPPIMPGWDEYPVAHALTTSFGCPTLVDNDVNLMALGEARCLPPDQLPLLFVKIGTGIGGGLVTADGQLHHGADGAALDIGHLRLTGGQETAQSGVVCSCGNVGCIEATSSVAAITRHLRQAKGDPTLTTADLGRLVHSGDATATHLVREAADRIGEAVAALVHICNPARIVLGSPLTAASDDILAGVRSVVYRRALPLATRNLVLAHSVTGAAAGVIGGIVLGTEFVLSPSGIDSLIRSHRARG
ncbi:MAG: ROK family protein [Propionibacteriaceae bacterium]|jgi:predicted NBD/HSP70 family sugar kinase|nr:ROK family protein [Propionibacteriaceae bacterium]